MQTFCRNTPEKDIGHQAGLILPSVECWCGGLICHKYGIGIWVRLQRVGTVSS